MVCLRLLTHTLMAFENLDTVHPSWRAPYFASLLREGAVVACPAEGVWGLSCDPNNETAVFDIPPSFITGRINWLAEVKGEISTSGH